MCQQSHPHSSVPVDRLASPITSRFSLATNLCIHCQIYVFLKGNLLKPYGSHSFKRVSCSTTRVDNYLRWSVGFLQFLISLSFCIKEGIMTNTSFSKGFKDVRYNDLYEGYNDNDNQSPFFGEKVPQVTGVVEHLGLKGEFTVYDHVFCL
ncbi:hypothetical protein O6H91_08G103300 [Diphasiastrum complanatum]|uniref:Uncharacterized protein n=1 Tax=Diphasiastrum complanatum TaxID=34168 RepID=A0ACC2D0S6_DIPCM|nr:hypothetical protein O6H91_08G103300 [Diphasiastrum complanatum]